MIVFDFVQVYAYVRIAHSAFSARCVFVVQGHRMDSKSSFNAEPSKSSYRPWLQVAIALLFIPLLAHIHKLSMILLPAFGLFVLYIVLLHRSRNQLRLLWISLAGGVVLLMLTFVVQLDALKMFRQVAEK